MLRMRSSLPRASSVMVLGWPGVSVRFLGILSTPTKTPSQLDPPSIDVLIAMLVNDQGFTDEEASCIAGDIYAAEFSDEVLSALQTGEIPAEVSAEISDIVDACAP